MKRKSLTMILCLLTCLSLVGVGFAAWVITAPAQDDVSSEIVVDTVTDKRLTVEAEVTSTAKSIVFGWKEITSGTDYNWLKNSDAEKKENLSIEITITVTAKDSTIDLKHDDITLNVQNGDSLFNQGLKDAITNKYVKVPTGELTATPVTDTDATDNVVQYTVTFTCAWGDHFAVGGTNVNPYQFYNSADYSEEKGNDAYSALKAIEAITGAKYNITVTATANA